MGARRIVAWLLAALVLVFGAVLSLGVWAFGVAQYSDGFCLQRQPTDLSRRFGEQLDYSGPSMASPTSVRCTFFHGSVSRDVVVTDWSPLIWTVVVALVFLGMAAAVVLLARHPARPAVVNPAIVSAIGV